MFTTWSVKRRLTAIAVANALVLNLLIVALMTPLVYLLLTDYVTEQTAAAARRIAYNVERYAATGELKPVATTEDIDLLQVVDNQGKVREASPPLLGLPPLITARPGHDDVRVDTTTCSAPIPDQSCLIAVGFRVKVNGTDWMSYAYSRAVPWYIHPLYVAGVLVGSVLLALLAGVVASAAIGNALRPVRHIRNELAEITATDLGRRVPRAPHQDELDDLARTINATLDRLEVAVEQQRRFASDASHDLRSPITAMRAQVEEAMLYPHDTDWPQICRALLSSLDRLQAIVTDLLTLTRLDAGAPGEEHLVDLSDLATVECARPRAKAVETALEPGVVVNGDRLRLARLLTNLLDNAERHAESTIIVSVCGKEGVAVLEVLDDGAGIAPDQREVVFRRFTRLDAARNRDAGGTGLGLAIAREIARAHGGDLTLEDSERGARFVLKIPLGQ